MLEIRCIIYRLLFVPKPSHYFINPEIPNKPAFIDGVWNENPKLQQPLHTAILCTNRQINVETTGVLYRELTLVICATDILGFSKRAREDILEPLKSSSEVWKYNPLAPPLPSLAGATAMPIYTSRPLHGKMYPHVFSRFENSSSSLTCVFRTQAPMLSRNVSMASPSLLLVTSPQRNWNFTKVSSFPRELSRISSSYCRTRRPSRLCGSLLTFV